ncbi:MAG: hypothetical protein JW751_25675, partial [Polyangiaceae bacterium]|nr:hypothetical protein [Polyangiaceae bacterium]
MTSARAICLRNHLVQTLAALAVGASGFASLATTACRELYTVDTARVVEFSETDQAHLLRVRVSPEHFESLLVTTDDDAVLEQLAPLIDDDEVTADLELADREPVLAQLVGPGVAGSP